MKFAFGLVGILAALAVIVVLMSTGLDYNTQVIKTGTETRETAVQLSGAGFNESFAAEAVERGGKIVGLEIKAVRPGGAMDAIFGLRAGDVITAIGPQEVRDINDEEMARALLMDVSRGAGNLEVTRGDQKLKVYPAGSMNMPGGQKVPGLPGNMAPIQSR
jgi:hypothetical protein